MSIDLIARNPFDIEWPARRRSLVDAITADEMDRLLKTVATRRIDGPRWVLPFVLGVDCGLRRGEIAALPWDAVDFENARITVRQAFSETRTRGVFLKPTKSERVRQIPLTTRALELLHRRRRQYREERFAHGKSYDPRGDKFVVADLMGRPYPPQKFSEVFRQTRERAKVRKSLHSTRHTFVTELLDEKVDVATVSALAGHASPLHP
jgi:integrase